VLSANWLSLMSSWLDYLSLVSHLFNCVGLSCGRRGREREREGKKEREGEKERERERERGKEEGCRKSEDMEKG
jgi:hypothetical protein